MDSNIRKLIHAASQDDDLSALTEAYGKLRKERQSSDDKIDAVSSDLFVLCAETALKVSLWCGTHFLAFPGHIDDSCEFFYIRLNCAHTHHKLYVKARSIQYPCQSSYLYTINDWFRYLHMKNSCFLILVSFLFLFCNLKTNMLHLTAEFTNGMYASVNSSCVQPPNPTPPPPNRADPLDISIFWALDGKFPWGRSSAGIDWCIVISFQKLVLWTLYRESFNFWLIIPGVTWLRCENNILIIVTQTLGRAKLR